MVKGHQPTERAVARGRALSGATVVAAGKDSVSCDLPDEAVILDLASGIYFGLDPVGARIWQLVQAPRTVDAICSAIVAEYAVEPERCELDVVTFVQQLIGHGLVEIGDAPAG